MTATAMSYAISDGAGTAAIVLAAPPLVVAVSGQASAEVNGLWTAMHSHGGAFEAVVDHVMDVGLRVFPYLAVVHVRPDVGQADVILRGEAAIVTRHADDSTVRHTSEGVRTWRELTVEGVEAVELDVGGGTTWWPLVAGVVAAAAVSWELNPRESVLAVQSAKPQVGRHHEVESVKPAMVSNEYADLQPREGVDPQPEVELSSELEVQYESKVKVETREASRLLVESAPTASVEHTSPPGSVPVDASLESPDLIGWVPIADVPLGGSDDGQDVLTADESDEQDQFDQLFGVTRHRSVEDAAVREPAATEVGAAGTPGPPVTAASMLGDRDGQTISREELDELHRGAAEHGPGGPRNAVGFLRAIICQTGHPNPPHADTCRNCGQPLTDRVVRSVAAGAPGVLVFADGSREVLNGPLVIGRRPRETGVAGQVAPRLVAVPSPEKMLSRSHVAVRVEGWSVTVTDLGTANGTEITLPAEAPQRLRGGQQYIIVPGTVINLADEVVMTYELGQ